MRWRYGRHRYRTVSQAQRALTLPRSLSAPRPMSGPSSVTTAGDQDCDRHAARRSPCALTIPWSTPGCASSCWSPSPAP